VGVGGFKVVLGECGGCWGNVAGVGWICYWRESLLQGRVEWSCGLEIVGFGFGIYALGLGILTHRTDKVCLRFELRFYLENGVCYVLDVCLE